MTKPPAFVQAFDAEWIQPKRKGWLMACCDCGLVHSVDFRLVPHARGKKVQLRPTRDEAATKRYRKTRGLNTHTGKPPETTE